MMEKYSFLPINLQKLTPAQTTLQRMSEKHLDFEIQAVNTIRPQILNIHIPRQSDINKKYRNTCDTWTGIPIQAQNLVKAYQTST